MMQQMEDYLRKLIKYEERLGVDIHQRDYFDNLYRKTTASFRAKLDAAEEENGLRRDGTSSKLADKENVLGRKVIVQRNARVETDGLLHGRGRGGGVLSDHKQQPKPTSKPEASGGPKTAASSKRRETVPAGRPVVAGTSTARTSRATEKSTNAMWIRPRSKTPHSGSNTHHTRMDPVQLYQYYQQEWEKFKTNLPGENNRSELRWQIRHKLLGEQ